MSNKLFQNVLKQIGGDVNRVLGVADEQGQVVACNVEPDEPNLQLTAALAATDETVGTVEGYSFKRIDAKAASDYFAFCEGVDEVASGYCSLLSTCFLNMRKFYDDKFDKNSFVKNIIMDNILPSDVPFRAKELSFATDVKRVVFLIKTNNLADSGISEILGNLFPDKGKDFIINIDHKEVVLVKEMKKSATDNDFQKTAQTIVDAVNSEDSVGINIGISNAAESVQDLSRAYRESRIAIEVGKVFGSEKNILSYDNLGIGRLIYQLPTTLCELFLNEVFKKESIDVLDDETLFTILQFFENNLNVSETSRQLFVHRNTLVYRLDKIKKLTGLDLREFEDAIVFKVAMMVNKYLNSQK